jgi:uncharacterized protein (TIRG00374 family)
VDIAVIGSKMANANFFLVPPFLAALALFYWLKAQRWGVIFDGEQPVRPRRLLPSMMVGFAGNNVLPLRLGEVVRIYLCGLDLGMSKSRVLGTMVLERVFDVATILVLLAAVTLWLPPVSAELAAARFVLLVGTVVAVIVVFGLVFTPRWLGRIGNSILGLLPVPAQRFVEPRFHQLREGFSVLRTSKHCAPILANSLMQWLLLAACVQLSIVAFGIEISPLAAVVIMALIIAGIALPGAPGFIGTIEYCFVAGLSFFGVSATDALSIAIFYHVLMFGSVVAVGAWYLRRYGLSWTDLKASAKGIKTT